MADHPELYEIVQKVFNAGQKFENDTRKARDLQDDFPAAYPVITPLAEELVAYVDEQIEECARIVESYWPHTPISTFQLVQIAAHIRTRPNDGTVKVGVISKIDVSPVCPSSLFRSVEIHDGEIK